mmetsp:Transcript_29860/g.45248  ORF Transcript_29860/g.45248 Transcript_29860/m.45248 type:complete len:211 (+) Transcript_29860:79-711(+)|eukprot:CAMPEP_0178920312 /NCGR_PEP_ID=MMETSP0786-20121207/14936_1 /TAXON_ID=186022 /ORGANISM="Thalassionema frauenfeldii, Strain CCMP 1798" /LENGTH=210 /DNA_ID=CAMNT_0020594367 /DNA_START=10 /DNA_END=642 /DNA_ORIENTATION=-
MEEYVNYKGKYNAALDDIGGGEGDGEAAAWLRKQEYLSKVSEDGPQYGYNDGGLDPYEAMKKRQSKKKKGSSRNHSSRSSHGSGGSSGGLSDLPGTYGSGGRDGGLKHGKPFKVREPGSYAVSIVADEIDTRKDPFNTGYKAGYDNVYSKKVQRGPESRAISWQKGHGKGLIAPDGPRKAKHAIKYYTLVAPDGKLILHPVDEKTGTADC